MYGMMRQRSSAMATMNISLPDEMKEWVEGQVAGGRFSNVSDFVRDVLRREQERQGYVFWLNAEIEKGIASGFSEMTTDEAFAKARAIAHEMQAKKDVA
jgi:antitoxin ParD1/3/4